MIIDFDEILDDLEVKRASLLPAEELPRLDVVDELPHDACRWIADAIATVAAARRGTLDETEALALVRDAAAAARARIDRLGELPRLAPDDVFVLVEAALIEQGATDVAKALVMRRSHSTVAQVAGAPRLVRRSGHVVAWNEQKIEIAIRKAFLSLSLDPEPAARIAERVSLRARSLGLDPVPIETVQDVVQEELVLCGQMRVAERYILYRAERAMLRAEGRIVALAPAAPHEELRARIRFAATGLDLPLSEDELVAELRRSVDDNLSRADLERLTVLNAKTLMERDSDFSFFAGRILLTFVYEETLGWDVLRDGVDGLAAAHRRALRPALERGVQAGRVDAALLEYDLDRLAESLDPTSDLAFDYLGLQTLYDRYLLVDKTGAEPRRLEAPQLFWLRVAMGVSLAEATEREERTLELYRVYAERRFCSATPTLFNAGTPHSQLSSCYLYVVDDSLESIMNRGIAENAMCSKWAGGLGGSWTAVRGTGSHIEGTNGESQGVIPFLKLHNDQLVAVNQGGKRAGAGCAYLEVWHNDIRDFLELKRNTGDERRRTHDMNTACWIPDLFMKRVEAREHWTLFRSSEVPDLHDTYGAAFAERYVAYEEAAARGEIHGERIEALELWKLMLRMLFETGHPWLTFKDPCNVRSPQDHAGVVHSSNLCTEITLNTSAEETAVCNLGSIVVDNHLTADGEIDHAKLRETVRVAVRALDNVIDVNFYPTEAARTANVRHRPVGLGVMGLQYALYAKGLAFESAEAIAFGDELMEAIAFYAYEASSDLAAERGTYASYAGSKWDRGLLPPDTVDLLEAERGVPVDVPRGGRLDWQPLREKIAAQGMRNSNVLAIAPTATISNIMGTSPCIEPLYKNLFVKANLSGEFVVLNPYLVRDLKAAGLWTRDLADRLKYFDGDLEQLEVPAELRARYRTAFQIPGSALIDAAARRQKWIDQSQSLNLFLAEPDLKAISHMYRRAWHAGVKTTYYLRTLGASAIEKATVQAAAAQPAPAPSAEALACSIEAAMRGEECEACQ
ncbi:MAG TPA: ribonucleoside-diphosphate reductase subunit alpha [Gaiellaceae bacterium]|nr:ribonucleoside-diphosphate reductase subunit alpha [Gaiellaceae bacterium]